GALDGLVEPRELLRAGLRVVGDDLDSATLLRRRLDAVAVHDAAAGAHPLHAGLEALAAGEGEHAREPLWRELVDLRADVLALPVDGEVKPDQLGHQSHAVLPGGNGKDARAPPLGELHGERADAAGGPEHHHRIALPGVEPLDPLPRGEAGGADRSDLLQVEPPRPVAHAGSGERRVLGVAAALRIGEGISIDLVVLLEAPNLRANLGDGAGA